MQTSFYKQYVSYLVKKRQTAIQRNLLFTPLNGDLSFLLFCQLFVLTYFDFIRKIVIF